MSLKQSSKEPATSRTGALGRVSACWGREADQDCLRIETREGETFILPYQHFVVAHLERQGHGEVLNISFASHRLRLEGRHLEESIAAIQEFAVDWIAATPARYQSLRDGDEATVVRLMIEAVG